MLDTTAAKFSRFRQSINTLRDTGAVRRLEYLNDSKFARCTADSRMAELEKKPSMNDWPTAPDMDQALDARPLASAVKFIVTLLPLVRQHHIVPALMMSLTAFARHPLHRPIIDLLFYGSDGSQHAGELGSLPPVRPFALFRSILVIV